jgi:hypothetical protein
MTVETPDINIGGNTSPTILGMTRVEFFKELNARSQQKFKAQQKATSWDTDELWNSAAARGIPTIAPVVKASDILRDYGYIKPCGHLPVPEFLWPCWLIKQTYRAIGFRSWGTLYALFAWCDECGRWDRYGAQEKWGADVINGDTFEARIPHHRGHPNDMDGRFFGFYNFGAAPVEIQAIVKKLNRTKKSWHTPPPEHLRRIQVVNDIE